MFRWLVLALLFALPAQFVMAAVSGYSGHGSEPALPHIGHHSHPRHGTAKQADALQAQSDQSSGQGHEGCSSCHVHVAQIGITDSRVPGTLQQSAFASRPIKLLSSWIHQSIDRPNWVHAG